MTIEVAWPLDYVDEAIVGKLREDGRASVSDIGTAVGISADAAGERVRRLLDSRRVRVVGMVRPGSVGVQAMGLVGIKVAGPILPVAEQLAALEMVDFVACTSGPFDILAEVLGTEESDLVQLLDDHIRAVPGVAETELFLYLSVEKTPTPVVADDLGSRKPLDTDELAIIDALREDGRMSYKALAARTGIKYPTCRRKAIALIETGVIAIHTEVEPERGQLMLKAAIGVRVHGPMRAALDRLRDIPQITVLATCSGRYDAFLDVEVESIGELRELVTRTLREVDGVVSTETFTYLRRVKRAYEWALPLRT